MNDKIIDKLTERLVARIEEANLFTLKSIAFNIKKIGELNSSSAYKLGQILKYGGDYDKIVKKLVEMTKLNEKDIYKIFEEMAKSDYRFAEQFYSYKNVKYIPWEQNIALQNKVQAMAKITAKTFRNLSKTSAIGFTKMINNKRVFVPIAEEYLNSIDRAVISVSQGKNSFEQELARTIKELTSSGLKTIDFDTGYTRRLDSQARMNLKDALRTMHNQLQEDFGQEFGSDGVEISVHEHPAPDHAEVQGRQFTNEEFDKFQNDKDAKDYTGKLFEAEFEGHDRRAISQLNCYHYTFSVVLGISKPRYNEKQLENIINKNEKGFEFENKHYSLYEGTQLQRKIETAIRKQKEQYAVAKKGGSDELMQESTQNITKLMNKYNDLCKISGLSKAYERLRIYE